MRCEGFEPFADGECTLLILGSFPSVKSREVQFYYGNPQNRFWRVLSEALGEPLPSTTDEKKAMLSRHKIALWDMVTTCEIEGSLDSNIKDYEVARLESVVEKHGVKRIITNGGKAAQLLNKHYPEYAQMTRFLPSTSPANARFDKTVWLSAVREATE